MIKQMIIAAILYATNAFGQALDQRIDTLSPEHHPDSSCICLCDDAVVNYPEKEPEFPGGPEELIRFIQENLNFPFISEEEPIQGSKIFVEFYINQRGCISGVTILKGVHPVVDAEVVRVINIMPKWVPGENNGNKVKVKLTLPINIHLR